MGPKWHFSPSWNEDGIDNEFATKEEAIAAGRRELGNDESFKLFRSREADACEFFPDAQTLFEQAEERACDEIGECAEGWPPDDSLKSFQADYEALVRKHFPKFPFRISERDEWVPALARDVEK